MHSTENNDAHPCFDYASWNNYIAQWLSSYRPATVKTYTIQIKLWKAWCVEHKLDPWLARRGDAETWLTKRAEEGVAPATVAIGYDAIKSFYTWLYEDELLDRNPWSRVNRPTVHPHTQRRTWLPPLRYAAFLAAAERVSPTAHAVAVLGGMLGLRSGEMCGLNVSDIKTHAGRPVLDFIGKGGKPDLVPIPLPAQDPVMALVTLHGSGPLLRSNYDVRLNTRSMVRLVNRIAREAGITDPITPHGLRRTFATTGLATNISERDMMVATRHVRLATLGLYDMKIGVLDNHASHRIAGFLSGLSG